MRERSVASNGLTHRLFAYDEKKRVEGESSRSIGHLVVAERSWNCLFSQSSPPLLFLFLLLLFPPSHLNNVDAYRRRRRSNGIRNIIIVVVAAAAVREEEEETSFLSSFLTLGLHRIAAHWSVSALLAFSKKEKKKETLSAAAELRDGLYK